MFEERLKQIREAHNLTQEQTAAKIGIPLRTYRSYENNQREPNSEMIITLSTFFDVSVDWLLGNSEIKRKAITLDYSGIEAIELCCEKNFKENYNVAESIIHGMTELTSKGLGKMKERVEELQYIPEYTNGPTRIERK